MDNTDDYPKTFCVQRGRAVEGCVSMRFCPIKDCPLRPRRKKREVN